MRLEIEHAIKSGKEIIPIIDKKFTAPHILPSPLEFLMNYQGIETEISDTNQLHFVLHKLTEFCTPKPRQLKKFLAIGIVTLILVFVGVVVLKITKSTTPPIPTGQNIVAGIKPDHTDNREKVPISSETSLSLDNESNAGGNQRVSPADEIIDKKYSTLNESNKKIIAKYCKITGNANIIEGNYNYVYGDDNIITGNYNYVSGKNNKISGNYNKTNDASNNTFLSGGKYNYYVDDPKSKFSTKTF